MNEASKYGRIIRAVQSMPWAIMPHRLAQIMDVLAFQSAGLKLSAEDIQAHVGVNAKARSYETGGAVAVVSLRGIIAHRIEQVDDISGPGGTSVQGFQRRFDEAMANDAIGAIVIDVDSPGGAVDGVPELAAHIRASRGTKPIVAVANTLAASAAYWLASSADEISVTASGEVGSIGVFTAHSDLSQRLEMEGEKVTLIHAGKYKVEGNPFEPLSEEAHTHIQGMVDGIYDQFIDAVAAGRNVAAKRVLSDFGEGRTVSAQDALKVGMVDRIETLDEAIARHRGGGRGRDLRHGRRST